jgi:hypothetical protein
MWQHVTWYIIIYELEAPDAAIFRVETYEIFNLHGSDYDESCLLECDAV